MVLSQEEKTRILDRVIQKLRDLEVVSEPYALHALGHQGYMSHAYLITSQQGALVIHVAKPFEHHFQYRTWEKLSAISSLVREKTALPVSRMIIAEEIDNTFVTVQTKLPGKGAATRAIRGKDVVDTWMADKLIVVPQIQEITAQIHALGLSGFGLPFVKNGELEGMHRTWPDFFLKDKQLWLRSLQARDKEGDLYREMTQYLEDFSKVVPDSSPCLIHGDLGNPSNVLVEKNKITGIIDWEWSIVGDPAWEFCDPGWKNVIAEFGLRSYLEARGLEPTKEKEFVRRAAMYRPLWDLWEAYIHRNDEDPIICDTLYSLMKEDLKEARTNF